MPLPVLPLVETISVPDTFCNGIGRIEDIGGCMRFTFYALEHLGEPIGLARVVKLKIIMIPDAVSGAAVLAISAAETVLHLDRKH